MSGIQNVLKATGNGFSIWTEIQTRVIISSLHLILPLFVQEHLEQVNGKFSALLDIFSRLAILLDSSFILGQFSHRSHPIVALIGHSLKDLTPASSSGIPEWPLCPAAGRAMSGQYLWCFLSCIALILNIFYQKKYPENSFLFFSLQITHLPGHDGLAEFLLKIPGSILS